MSWGGMRQCAWSSFEKTRVFDPHMSARLVQRFGAQVQIEKSRPRGCHVEMFASRPRKNQSFARNTSTSLQPPLLARRAAPQFRSANVARNETIVRSVDGEDRAATS